ncbi:MAG: glycosyltransferase [Pseudomonadota bacterium]
MQSPATTAIGECAQSACRGAVAVVLKGYPRLSETFIAQELYALEQRGLPLRLYSLRHPTDKMIHPVHERIVASCSYLPEYLYLEPFRVVRAWWRVRRLATYRAVRRTWLRDLLRDRTPNRIRRFGQALVLAAELPNDIVHIYAHFLHTPASVARYAANLTERTWSVSAHAKDIWTSPNWEKQEKLADCVWAVTCTQVNADHLTTLAPAERVHLLYHGLDVNAFPAEPRMYGQSDGQSEPVHILSVGRAVPKKGYDDVITALGELYRRSPQCEWRFVHIGGGPLLPALKAQADQLGIASRIEWRGPRAQPEVLQAYRESDLFLLASKIADDGDRDGLPNVLMEAQSQGVACAASAVSAIPELLIGGETGELFTPGDTDAMAAVIEGLITDPGRRERLGRAGQARLQAAFSLDDGADWLAKQLLGLIRVGV